MRKRTVGSIQSVSQNTPYLRSSNNGNESKLTIHIVILELSQEDRKGCLTTFDCYGILGIVNLVGFNFLVTVDSRGQSPAAVLYNDRNVYEVQQIKLTPFHRDMNLEANPRLSILYESFLKLFNGNGIGSGFYFSYHADLTMSL